MQIWLLLQPSSRIWTQWQPKCLIVSMHLLIHQDIDHICFLQIYYTPHHNFDTYYQCILLNNRLMDSFNPQNQCMHLDLDIHKTSQYMVQFFNNLLLETFELLQYIQLLICIPCMLHLYPDCKSLIGIFNTPILYCILPQCNLLSWPWHKLC